MKLFDKIIAQVKNDSEVVEGVALESDETRHSTTRVYSTGTGSGKHVSSSVSTHHNQRLWVRLDDGTERALDYVNQNIEFRPGHRVRLVISRHTGSVVRTINLTTGMMWRRAGNGFSLNNSHTKKSARKVGKSIYGGWWRWLLGLAPVTSIHLFWRFLPKLDGDYPYHRLRRPLALLLALAWTGFFNFQVYTMLNTDVRYSISSRSDPYTTIPSTVIAPVFSVFTHGVVLAMNTGIIEDSPEARENIAEFRAAQAQSHEAVVEYFGGESRASLPMSLLDAAYVLAFFHVIIGGLLLLRLHRGDIALFAGMVKGADDLAHQQAPKSDSADAHNETIAVGDIVLKEASVNA